MNITLNQNYLPMAARFALLYGVDHLRLDDIDYRIIGISRNSEIEFNVQVVRADLVVNSISDIDLVHFYGFNCTADMISVLIQSYKDAHGSPKLGQVVLMFQDGSGERIDTVNSCHIPREGDVINIKDCKESRTVLMVEWEFNEVPNVWVTLSN